MTLSRFLSENSAEIFQYTQEHLLLVGVSVILGTLMGVPLGIISTRWKRSENGILGAANIVQTVPSLALLGFLIPVPFLGGVGPRTAIVALTLYSLLPIIKNTHAGIRGVSPAVKEAGEAMGMTPLQILFQVELPLASGVIMAGIRIAAVVSIGVATIAAAIGAGGLGVFIFRGVSMVNNQMILAGAIPAAIMALTVDFGLSQIEKRMTRRAGSLNPAG